MLKDRSKWRMLREDFSQQRLTYLDKRYLYLAIPVTLLHGTLHYITFFVLHFLSFRVRLDWEVIPLQIKLFGGVLLDLFFFTKVLFRALIYKYSMEPITGNIWKIDVPFNDGTAPQILEFSTPIVSHFYV